MIISDHNELLILPRLGGFSQNGSHIFTTVTLSMQLNKIIGDDDVVSTAMHLDLSTCSKGNSQPNAKNNRTNSTIYKAYSLKVLYALTLQNCTYYSKSMYGQLTRLFQAF